MKEYPSWPRAKNKPRKNGIYWFYTGKQTGSRGRVGYNIPESSIVIDVFNIDENKNSKRISCSFESLDVAPEIKAEFQKLLNHLTPHVLEA